MFSRGMPSFHQTQTTTVVNIVMAHAAARIQLTHNEIETNTVLFQQFFDDLDIHHQRHRYVDVPLILEARDALFSSNYWLNTARSRLTTMRASMAPGRGGDIYDMFCWGLALHSLLYRARETNHYIRQLFYQVRSTTHVFGNTVRNTFPTQLGSNTQEYRDFSPEQDEENSSPRMNA